MKMSRFRAAAYHLGASLIVGLLVFGLFWFVWYPSPMLIAIGGHEIFLLILCVDIILGPLMTLVVFKTEKKSLRFDLIVIVALQILAMSYGASTLLEARPVYVAAVDGHFHVVLATQVTDENLKKANTVLPLFGPKIVGTLAPTTQADKDAVEMVLEVGGDRGNFPQLHIAYDAVAKNVEKAALPLSELTKKNDEVFNKIADSWRIRNHDLTSIKYQPIEINGYLFPLLIEGKTGKIIEIAPFIMKR